MTSEEKDIPISAKWRGPGPASYSVPSTFGEPRVYKKAPAYSFGSKPNPAKIDTTPSPNAFFPKVQSRTPAFSLQSRVPEKIRSADQPGPAQYYPRPTTNITIPNGAGYTIAGRNFVKVKGSEVPSPSDYSTRTATAIVMKSVPAYSITSVHPIKSTEASPGPAAYSTEKAFHKLQRSDPSISFGRKWMKGNTMPLEPDDVFIDGMANLDLFIPSPNHYHVNTKAVEKSNPAYSFRSRHSQYEAEVPDIMFDEK